SVLKEIGGFHPAYEKAKFGYGGEDRDLTWRVRQMNYDVRVNLMARVSHKHRESILQMVSQAYNYGKGCYLHCRLAGLPLDYEPHVRILRQLFSEYLVPYRMWVSRYYREGASLPDALVFPLLDFVRRCASAMGAAVAEYQLRGLLSNESKRPVQPQS